MAAACNDHMGIVRHLIEAGADINDPGNLDENALQRAARLGNHGTLTILLKAGADVHAKSPPEKRSALEIAVNYGRQDC